MSWSCRAEGSEFGLRPQRLKRRHRAAAAKPVYRVIAYYRGIALHFVWDPVKADVNLAKHDVAFHEALTVFQDPTARIFDDDDHFETEHREIIVRRSKKQRLLIVCFCERQESVRIISARRSTSRERRDYEEYTKE